MPTFVHYSTVYMTNYTLNIKNKSRVIVGDVESLLGELLPVEHVVVISDTNVDRYHHSLIERYPHILLPLGESGKTLTTVEHIYHRFVEMGVDRSWFVLGIGGGIVTDVTGFAASTYMRGLHFGFISTTLLGQVDASVGGKNGVNFDGYKNMVGTFSQPDFVVCDVHLLQTLSDREFRTGLAEIIKASIIADRGLFEMLESCDFSRLKSEPKLLRDVVFRAITIKADIVERDERESGERRKLNLGHTLAHAIEKCCSKLNHGEAVAVGLHLMTQLSVEWGVMAWEEAHRIDMLLQRAGFVLELPVPMRDILAVVGKDKKSEGSYIHIVLPESIGSCRVDRMLQKDFVESLK